MKTLLYVLTISGLTVGTKLIEIAYNLGLRFLIRRTNFYKISKANITTVFANKSKNEIDNKLEQLRALDAGISIGVAFEENIPAGVDTKEDLINAESIIRAHYEKNSNDFKFLYQEDIPHGDALDKYELTSGVDIGSGTGWFANYLVEQRKYKKVYAIEPSSSAIEIAKKIYPDNKKVKYINGFAEEEISKLKLSKPTFFSTMCCLAHLEDEDVLGILKTIDKIAPVDSVLACSEPWGDFYHRECWNIRPPEWWSDTLADWEFEFYNDYILTDPPGRSKGFIAIKK